VIIDTGKRLFSGLETFLSAKMQVEDYVLNKNLIEEMVNEFE